MKKRIVSLLMALVLCVGLLPAVSLGAEIVSRGNCGANWDNVTYTLDSDGLMTISGSGAIRAYTMQATTVFDPPP